MKEYRTNVTKQDDVVDLFNRVQVEYNEAVTENEELAAFLTELSENLKTAVGDALAEAEQRHRKLRKRAIRKNLSAQEKNRRQDG